VVKDFRPGGIDQARALQNRKVSFSRIRNHLRDVNLALADRDYIGERTADINSDHR
jgi:hypothetical protein